MKLIGVFCAFFTLIDSSTNAIKATIWGPALNGDFTLPVRYFFLDFKNDDGERLQNVSIDDIRVEFLSNGKVKQYHADLLRTGNFESSFVYRFRPYQSHNGDLILNVFYKTERLVSQLIKGPISSENCDCPIGLQKWLIDIAKCPALPRQILNDLAPFGSKIKPKYNRDIMKKFYDMPYSVSICNYIVKKNKIYRKCLGEYTGFTMFMDSILISLARKVKLPDVDFLVNLGDYPLAKKDERRYKPQIPIFSWCGSEDSLDIVMPTYEIVEASVRMMDRVSLDIFSVQDQASHSYFERIPKAFWRGRDSREERLRLVELSQREPKLLNASITNFFFFRDQMEKYGGKTAHISFFDFFEHKLQINVDGTVAAYRLPFLLSGGSTVLKSSSSYYEHFYERLEADVHYIAVKNDLSDLLSKIRFCLDNEEHCEAVARNGRQFVNDNLLPHHIYCYHVQLLNEYAQRIEGAIEIPDEMELVDHHTDECQCPQKMTRDEL